MNKLKQAGTKIHDGERFIFELLDGSSISDAKPLDVGHENWDIMMKYAEDVIRAVNCHEELLAVAKEMDALMENLWTSVDWGKTHGLDIANLNTAPIRLRAAIAKAGGKP